MFVDVIVNFDCSCWGSWGKVLLKCHQTSLQQFKYPPPPFYHQGNFGGQCILYGHVNYSADLIGVQSATSPSLCYFVSAISVIVAVVCFSLSLYWLYAFCIDGDMTR